MRNEAEFVDVHTRAKLAAERVRAKNGLSGSLHLPQTKPVPWYKPENLIVAGREVKGFVVPHWASAILLATFIGAVSFMYNRVDAQRDLLIRLETKLEERDKHELEYRSEFKNQLNVQKVYIDNMTNQLNTIKGMLTPQQVRSMERSAKKMENAHAPIRTLPRVRGKGNT